MSASADTARKFRTYMVVRTQMSLATGLLVGAFAWVAGLQFAVGVGRHRLCAELYPLHRPVRRDLVPDPARDGAIRARGRRCSASSSASTSSSSSSAAMSSRASRAMCSRSRPLVVLFSVFFWTFLWGLYGAFIGVPIAIAALTFCAPLPVEPHGSPICSAGRRRRRRSSAPEADRRLTQPRDQPSSRARRRRRRPHLQRSARRNSQSSQTARRRFDLDPLGLEQTDGAIGSGGQRMDVEVRRLAVGRHHRRGRRDRCLSRPQVPIQSMWRWPCMTTMRAA